MGAPKPRRSSGPHAALAAVDRAEAQLRKALKLAGDSVDDTEFGQELCDAFERVARTLTMLRSLTM